MILRPKTCSPSLDVSGSMSIKVKLPVIKRKWCLEALDEQYKKSLLRERQRNGERNR